MLLLHASALENQLVLWGEAPPAAGKRRRAGKAPASPLDPGGERLSRALAEVLPDLTVARSDSVMLTAWLPEAAGRPLASSRLIAEPPPASEAVTLAPWTVSAIELPPQAAVELLGAAADRNTLAPGVVVGKTLAFWTRAFRFAAALVARQQFLPGVRQQGKESRACWQVVLAGPDAAHFSQLIRAMPHACRALTRSADAPPDTPAETVVRALLDTFADHLVRPARRGEGRGARGEKRAKKTSALVSPLAPRPSPLFKSESVHDQWLHALRSPDGLMAGDAKDLNGLAEQVREWRRPITVASTAPFRLCFRLEEPPQPDGADIVAPPGKWHLHYLLQANDDPSLLVPVADAWKEKGGKASLLRRGSFNAREYLLSALGQAASIDPDIERSLKKADPAGIDLDVSAAHAFLTERAWLLEQAGFGVLLPSWWTRKGTKQKLAVRAHVKSPKMQGGSGLGLTDLIAFDWRVAIGDTTLTLKELETLARMKVPLVSIRGQWVQLSAEEIQKAIDFWKTHPTGTTTVREALRLALGAAQPPVDLPLDGLTAEGDFAELLTRLEKGEDFEELPPPAGFIGTLRPYQARGYSWLAFLRRWGLGACLADDMGLGKTVQTLALLRHQWQTEKKPVLLVCPVSVVGNWQKEVSRFTPELPVLVHHGSSRIKGTTFRKEAEKHALVLSGYALLHRDFDVLKQVDWAGLILDEAQNIKNPETKQARAARPERRLAPGPDRDAGRESRRRFVVDLRVPQPRLPRQPGGVQARRSSCPSRPSATPTPSSDCSSDRPIRAAPAQDRQGHHRRPARQAGDESLLHPDPGTGFAVRRRRRRTVPSTSTRPRAFSAALILGTLSKLKQVCNHPAHFLGDNSAIPEPVRQVAASDGDDRGVAGSRRPRPGFHAIHRDGRHSSETFAGNLRPGGAVPARRLDEETRDEMVDRFQQPGGPAILLLSLKAGGTGLNLTAANHVFHFDRWWNPAVENQATDRAFRIGQTQRVQVHKFLCLGTARRDASTT